MLIWSLLRRKRRISITDATFWDGAEALDTSHAQDPTLFGSASGVSAQRKHNEIGPPGSSSHLGAGQAGGGELGGEMAEASIPKRTQKGTDALLTPLKALCISHPTSPLPKGCQPF